MFSEDLSKLIEASLVDGVITDQERAVIRKRALLEGVDPDEVDLLLDAEVQKISKKPSTEKQGDIKKCPACGAIYEAGDVKCSQCGYTFINVAANKSSVLLAKKLESIISGFKEKNEYGELDTHRLDDLLGNAIQNFPVPTSKEDLLEFIPSMESKWSSTSTYSESQKEAYRAKYLECLAKAKALFGNDPHFQYFFEHEEQMNKKLLVWSRLSIEKRLFIMILGLFAFALLCGIISYISNALK